MKKVKSKVFSIAIMIILVLSLAACTESTLVDEVVQSVDTGTASDAEQGVDSEATASDESSDEGIVEEDLSTPVESELTEAGDTPVPPSGDFEEGEMPQPPEGDFGDGEAPEPPGDMPEMGDMPQMPDGEVPQAPTEDVNVDVEIDLVETDSTSSTTVTSTVEGSILDTTDMFSNRDLKQTADTSEATYLTLTDGEDITITSEGVYFISGSVEEVTIVVEADDEAKVQLVLDGVSIVNEDAPAIYVKSGDKVFVTTTSSNNYFEVSGLYTPDGDTNLDAVIFSRSDLVINGTGSLEVVSAEGNGITSKDDLKVTGGILIVTSEEDGLEANDSIRIYDGDITIVSNKDAIHSENDEDLTLGYVFIQGGNLTITAADDGIMGNSITQIDGGTINIIKAAEGIEGTYVQINGGTIDIYATDDGINAAAKTNYDVVIEVNGGDISVVMGSGDTDAFDANGSIYINGGMIDVEATSAFDADRTAELNGGTVTVNGQVITTITQSQMGGGFGGGGRGGMRRK